LESQLTSAKLHRRRHLRQRLPPRPGLRRHRSKHLRQLLSPRHRRPSLLPRKSSQLKMGLRHLFPTEQSNLDASSNGNDLQCKLLHLGQHDFRGNLAESLLCVQGRW